jgi:two-component system LytT family response regulator
MPKPMIKAILVDDENKALETLKMLLEHNFPGKFKFQAMCNSVDQAVSAIQEHEPDLVFLDIQMPVRNGFALLEITPHRSFEVIFTTAHADYAIPALKHSAFDYLLKPIDSLELQKTIVRYEEKRKTKAVESTLRSIENQLNPVNVIALITAEAVEYINLNDILYLKASGNYTEFHMKKGNIILQSKNIGVFEKRLEASNRFIRIHDTFLVNSTKFEKYDKVENYLILKGGAKVSVAVRKSATLNNGFY